MNSFCFSQPFFVVLIELALFDILIEFDIIGLAKNG